MAGDNENHGERLPPVHPGDILLEEFLIPLGMSQYRLAKAIGVDPRRIHAIVHRQRGVTADTALLLGKFFGITAAFWLRLQMRYDLEMAEGLLNDRLSAVVPLPREEVEAA